MANRQIRQPDISTIINSDLEEICSMLQCTLKRYNTIHNVCVQVVYGDKPRSETLLL